MIKLNRKKKSSKIRITKTINPFTCQHYLKKESLTIKIE